jgi:formylglycine-generating enzyme required for sulfatase activity
VHRDIKPENLFWVGYEAGKPVVQQKVHVKVLDFGISERVKDSVARLTGFTRAGTASYVSPEVLANQKVGPAGDVYALGVTLYELVEGEAPFTGPTDSVVFELHRTAEPRPGKNWPRLWPLIAACLAKQPDERPLRWRQAIAVLDKGEEERQAAEAARRAEEKRRRDAERGEAARQAEEERRQQALEDEARKKAAIEKPEVEEVHRPPRIAKSRRLNIRVAGVAIAVLVVALALVAMGKWPGWLDDIRQSRRPTPIDVAENTEATTGVTSWTNPQDELEYVQLPAGEFKMGCVPGDIVCDADENPRHPVTIPRSFWIGRTEVTVAAYRRFANAKGQDMPTAPNFNPDWQNEDHPIVRVSWNDAQAFCEWTGGRLPSEAEWEYAARGGKEGLKYPWGNGDPVCRKGAANGARFDDDADCDDAGTEAVASYGANGFGLYDMSGNAWEWVQDRWHDSYQDAPPDGSPWLEGESVSVVVRGGSWYGGPGFLRCSYRIGYRPVLRSSNVGFRCVRDEIP